MIQSVEEGVKRYRTSFKTHLDLVVDMKKKYGEIDPMSYDTYDYYKVKASSNFLRGMVLLLDFSKEEEVRIDQEVKDEVAKAA